MLPVSSFSRFRSAFVILTLALASTALVAAASASGTTLPAFGDVIVRFVSFSAVSVRARNEEPVTMAEKGQTTPNEGIVFGLGDLPLLFPTRNDRISGFGPGGVPSAISSLNDFEPSWSPDGSSIVFISLRGGPGTGNFMTRQQHRDIFTMNADGSNQRRITGPFFGGESQPSFSPHPPPNRKIVYVADYGPGGGPSGIFTINPDGTNQQRLDTDPCFAIPGPNPDGVRKRSRKPDLFPGIYGFDTPVYSPDGNYIIFGHPGDNGTNVYRIGSNGSNCVLLYASQGSYAPTQARYSPDGSRIALYHEEAVIGGATAGGVTRKIMIIDGSTGSPISEWQPSALSGHPVWSPNGLEIAYFSGSTDPQSNQHIPNTGIRSFDPANGVEQEVYFQGVPEALRGMSWGVPSTQVPQISLRINAPHPLTSGRSTTATVRIAAPAPAGGLTISLTSSGATGAITVPSTVLVAEGQSEATFQVDSSPSTLYRSSNITATRPAPNFSQAIATVSLSPSRPDLRAVSFTSPPTADPGIPFNVSWTVENIGPVTTGANGSDDVVYFSTDAILDPGDGLPIRTVGNGELPADASRTRNTTATIPGSLVPASGNYYLIFRTNPNETVNENGATSNNEIAAPITVNLPDVLIENITAPATVEPGVPYQVSWTVRNGGGAPTGPPTFRNRLYFSLDGIAGNDDDVAFTNNTDFPSLAPGASVAQSVTVTVPTVPVRPTGPAFFYVRGDVENTVYEGAAGGTGESNNTTFASIQFEYRVPDLLVNSVTVPPEAETDTPFALGWTTGNAGNKDAAAFTEEVYFSTDNQIGGDILIGTFPLAGGLGAGSTVERIQNVTIPTGSIATSGNYYVYVRTDTAGNVDEGINENNNIRFQQISVRRILRPDLVITNVTAPPTAFFDQTVQVQWTVTNTGPGPTNSPQWRDRLYLGTSPTSISGATVLSDSSSISALNPGESYTASATVKIPRGLTGAYHFLIRTNQNGAVNEESTANNLLSAPIQLNVPPLPDLVVASVQAPDEVFAGQGISIQYSVTNIGTADAGGRRDRIYFSRDAVLNTGQDKLVFTSDWISGLAAGQTASHISQNRFGFDNPPVYQLARIPSDLEGLWYVFVVADYADSVYEFTGENNNTGYDSTEPGSPMNILVTPPDLVVENAPTAPSTASSGTSISVSFTVKNQGAFNAGANLFHAVYLSTDATFDAATDTLIGSVRDTAIFPPGSQHPFAITGRLPNCLADGNYYLFAVADYDNRQFEFDPGFDAEANNSSPPRLIQLATTPPDLQITSLTVPPIITPGQAALISWTVSNPGGATTGNWIDRIYLNSLTPGILTQSIGSFERTGGLAPGGSYTQTRSVGLPSFMEGEYFITVKTDESNTVPECGAAETNNVAQSANFTVQNNLPDLVVDSVTAPTTATVGDTFQIQWVGRNANGAMPPGSPTWRDNVYLSTDTTLSNGDISLGAAINSTILSSGQSYPAQTNVTIGNVPAGNYHILVAADAGRNIYEGTNNSNQETNNIRASAQITLSAPAVDLQVSGVSVSLPHHSGTFRNISWTVTNTGSSQTLGSNWSDYVYLSRDAVLDPTDRVLGYRNRSDVLAGGASYVQMGTFLIPNGLTGDYNVIVVTDKNNAVVESNNSNNTSPPLAVNLTLPPPAEMSITHITPPATIPVGGLATFTWTVQNTGANPVEGQWRDTVYLSRDQFWDASDTLIGTRDLNSQTTSVPAGGGTYTGGYSGLTPPVDEGTYYVIVRTDAQNRIRESDEANNVSASVGTTTVTVAELQLNTPLNTTLGNGAQMFFKYATQPAETLLFSLATDRPERANEAFTNFGTMVSRADYDFQSTRPGEGNQENVIGETQEGSYYSMVRTDLIPESFSENFEKSPGKTDARTNLSFQPQNITVEAKILPFSVRKVTPDVAGNAGYSTLLVEGAKFRPGATLKLVHSNGTQIVPLKLDVEQSRIIAIFDLKGKPAGVCDIVVNNPDTQTATLDDGFTIVNGGGASEPRVSIEGPGASRGGRMRYTFSFSNDGLNDQFFVPLIITMPSIYSYQLDESNYTGDLAEFLPRDAVPSQLPRHIEINGTRAVMLFAPIIASRRSVNVNLDITLPFGFSAFEITAMTLPPLEEWGDIAAAGQAETLARQVQQFSDPAKCSAKLETCLKEVLRGLIFNIIAQVIPANCVNFAFKSLVGVSDMAIGILKKGKETGFWDAVGAMSNLIAGGLSSAALDCLGVVAPWIEVAGLAVFVVKAMYDLWDCYRQRDDCLPPPPVKKGVSFPFSFDPNEKIGPKGFGGDGFVPIKQPLEYRINFENLSSATAPAQLVRITDTLPPPLDLRTVRLKEIGFKQYRFVIPANQSFYQERVQLGDDLGNLQADILAGVDLANNRIFWNIQAIDPNTSEAPLDPFAGILPPNNPNRDGEGYVIFTVEARPTFPNRTMISNSATIIFDQNEPIITNATNNLLDSVVPTSQIAALPATSEDQDIQLNWSGTDDADGSGFAGYSILYSENGGSYLPYLTTATDTTARFTGKWGKTYRFYSIGRDNAGNIESAPLQPDATIRVLGGDTEGDVAPRPNGSDGSLNGDDLTQVRRFVARLDSAMQYNEFQRADTAPRATGGEGRLSVADVMQARRYAAGADPVAGASGPNAAAPFVPETVADKSAASLLPREVKAETISRVGNRLTVGLYLESQGDETGVGLTVNYDPSVLSNPAVTAGSDTGTAVLTANTSGTGVVGLLADREPTAPFAAGRRHFATIEFDVAVGAPASTVVTFDDDVTVAETVNGDANSLQTAFASSTISLLGPTSANASVSGRVLAADGNPIGRATVRISSGGFVRQARSNQFGRFSIDGIPVGAVYTIEVRARGYAFAPRILAIDDEVSDLVIVADP